MEKVTIEVIMLVIERAKKQNLEIEFSFCDTDYMIDWNISDKLECVNLNNNTIIGYCSSYDEIINKIIINGKTLIQNVEEITSFLAF